MNVYCWHAHGITTTKLTLIFAAAPPPPFSIRCIGRAGWLAAGGNYSSSGACTDLRFFIWESVPVVCFGVFVCANAMAAFIGGLTVVVAVARGRGTISHF